MRITGGTLRSRQLQAPRGQATRPTSDRVREALFGILGATGVLRGARVLDLYAGTGALAIEALSRGAAHATLVESSREALAALRANVEALGLRAVTSIVVGSVEATRSRVAREGPFDLVLADPPWALVDEGGPSEALSALARAGALSPDAVVVLEHDARSAPPQPRALEPIDRRRYGDTALTLYKPAILPPPRPVGQGSPSE